MADQIATTTRPGIPPSTSSYALARLARLSYKDRSVDLAGGQGGGRVGVDLGREFVATEQSDVDVGGPELPVGNCGEGRPALNPSLPARFLNERAECRTRRSPGPSRSQPADAVAPARQRAKGADPLLVGTPVRMAPMGAPWSTVAQGCQEEFSQVSTPFPRGAARQTHLPAQRERVAESNRVEMLRT